MLHMNGAVTAVAVTVVKTEPAAAPSASMGLGLSFWSSVRNVKFNRGLRLPNAILSSLSPSSLPGRHNWTRADGKF